MARARPKPTWDTSAEPPDYRTNNSSQQYTSRRLSEHTLGDYSPSTSTTQAAANRRVAAAIAKKRRLLSFVPKPGGGLNVFDRNNYLVGTKEQEDLPTHRVTPRKLGQRGQS